jgi:serine/threonine protein kinase
VVEPTLVGQEIEHYRLAEALGAGGMGVVYLAEDLALRRKVAVKVLPSRLIDDPTARARFQQEIESAVSIEHPHIVPVYDAGYDGERFYIVMRYVEGPDLSQLIREEGPIAEPRAMRLLGQIASALYAVHQAGLVHRDVKPHNVLVWGASDPDEHAMLTDFGIAKALNDTTATTGIGPVGTPAYMAPEVCAGEAAVPASDQYSLACVAFQMISGRRPFEADSFAVRDAHMNRQPAALADCAPGTSRAVCEAIARALEKSPGRRFPDVRGLVAAAAPASESFDRAQAITRVVRDSADTNNVVSTLHDEYGLSDGTIAEITDLNRTEVVRRRRRAASRVLTGQRKRR